MSERPARRYDLRKLLTRIDAEWRGSDLELEIRAGVPGKLLRAARKGRTTRGTSGYWRALSGFLDGLSPA